MSFSPSSSTTIPEFMSSDLQLCISTAAQHQKILFCFVSDESTASARWQEVIEAEAFRTSLVSNAVTLRIKTDTTEAQYLNAVSPIQSSPAVVIIKDGQVREHIQHDTADLAKLQQTLTAWFSSVTDKKRDTGDDSAVDAASTAPEEQQAYITFEPSTGRMRLPNNAYDELRTQTQTYINRGVRGSLILKLQLRLLKKIPTMHDAVQRIEASEKQAPVVLEKTEEDRLLNTPASALKVQDNASSTAAGSQQTSQVGQSAQDASSATTATTPRPMAGRSDASPAAGSRPTPTPAGSDTQQSQRTDYVRQQREREAAQHAERERIKAQIKSDREERRRLDQVRKQTEVAELRQANSTTRKPSSADIRIQVRTFDGTTIRQSFTHNSTLTKDVRPWIDATSSDDNPYNLKLVLTPLPNRNIETGEEELSLSDLGLVGSATMIMVPVKTYVDSYAAGGGGLFGTVYGAASSVVGGIGSYLGFGASTPPVPPVGSSASSNTANVTSVEPVNKPQVRVRTLADQRADEAKKQNNELYNGNQLNFQGRRDDDDDDDDDDDGARGQSV